MSTTLTVEATGVPTAPTSDTEALPWGLIRHSITLAGRSILKIKRMRQARSPKTYPRHAPLHAPHRSIEISYRFLATN